MVLSPDRTEISETWEQSWGEMVCPGFLEAVLQDRIAQTLSLWTDIESVFAYSYGDVHAEGMKRRKEWVRDPEYPNYAAWWVADDHQPTYAEATARLEALHQNGPSPNAFNFKQAFGADSLPLNLDQFLIRCKLQRNIETRLTC